MMTTDSTSQDGWKQLVADAVSFRHELHRWPELTWREAQTAQRIRERLSAADIPFRSCARLGTVAWLAPEAKGEHVALRADMDALPISEAADVPWASKVEGCMHACGHDGHTAALMASALWLKRHEAALPGPVSLIFQPAEEGGHGAREMIADGALEGIDVIFGWHNWPAIAHGQAVCPDGAVMAGNGTFVIELQGRGGHASQPELCRDPVLAASAITLALQQIVARRIAPQKPNVVSVTSIDGKSGPTVIRDAVSMEGSIRFTDAELRDPLCDLITEVTEYTASAYGVKASVTHHRRYDPTVNHARPASRMRAALAGELGASFGCDLALPIMASEDFGYYLKEIPGAFALLGGGSDAAHREPCHSPRYRFNDGLLQSVMGIFSRLAGLQVSGDDDRSPVR
ncbi:MAG: N(2)-acetyl-L-2,4-diaminobutanoate deacetylase DoeB2 [Myxococcales bacterium]|nr:N(2)-acetyl-L-2,4-diaminobutanoate deacetylase DoeB2 [Myxococcales bacterium]